MKRFIRFRWAGVACAGLLAFIALPTKSEAQLVSLTFGNTVNTPVGVLDSTNGLPGTVIANTGAQAFTSTLGAGDFSGTLQSMVIRETGTGTLDFVYEFNSNGGSGASIEKLTVANFNGFTTNVGFITGGLTNSIGATALVPGAPGTIGSTTVNETAAPGIISFNFITPGNGLVTPGSTTQWLVVQTNATAFTAGTASVINAGVATVAAFAPLFTPIPEIGSLFCGLAVAGFAGFQLFRRKGGKDEMPGLAA